MNNKDASVRCTMQISVAEKQAEIQIDVPAGKVKLQRMLPFLQELTNMFVQNFVRKTEKDGRRISCKAKCGACCRQLVPISKIEAYHLSKLVRNLPALEKKKISKRFEKAVEQLESIGWMAKMRGVADLSFDERQTLGIEYFQQGIPCPFLENESCSIHKDRPLVCREYLVTSPAENCASPSGETIDMVPVQPKLSPTLNKLSAEIIGDGEPGYIPLVNTLEWTRERPDLQPAKTGREWVEMIVGNMGSSDRQGDPEKEA